MRPHAVEKKFPVIKQSDCKDISGYLKTSCDHYPNRHKTSIYCLPATFLACEWCSLIFLALCGQANVQDHGEERGQTAVFAGFYFSQNVKRWVGSLGTGGRGG